MDSTVTAFRPRPRPQPPEAQPDAPRPAPAGRAAAPAPAASLPLLLRGAPAHLSPEAVAGAMLTAGSNPAAGPVWRAARDELLALGAARGLDLRGLLGIAADYHAAVRAAGIAAKARRRAQRAADDRFFDDPENWTALLGTGAELDRA